MKLTPELRRRAIAPPLPVAVRATGRLSVLVEVRTCSEMNRRDHWRVGVARKISQKCAVAYALRGHTLPALPASVTLTRYAPKRLDGHDNLPLSLKYLADSVAGAYGVADDGAGLTWVYEQEPGVMRGYHVRIEIVSASPARQEERA